MDGLRAGLTGGQIPGISTLRKACAECEAAADRCSASAATAAKAARSAEEGRVPAQLADIRRTAAAESSAPLFVACRLGAIAVARTLAASDGGKSLSSVNGNGVTLLCIACHEGHLRVVQWLVGEMGCDASGGVPNDGEPIITPIATAAMRGHVEIVRYLSDECGAALWPQDEPHNMRPVADSVLSIAAWHGHCGLVTFVCTRGAPLNAAIGDGIKPLEIAAMRGQLAVVKQLHEEGGVAVTEANANGDTPFLISCWEGHLNCCKYLLSRGADPEGSNAAGDTPIAVATWEGYAHVVEWSAGVVGVPIGSANDEGATPLDIARSRGDHVITRMLSTTQVWCWRRRRARPDGRLPARNDGTFDTALAADAALAGDLLGRADFARPTQADTAPAGQTRRRQARTTA